MFRVVSDVHIGILVCKICIFVRSELSFSREIRYFLEVPVILDFQFFGVTRLSFPNDTIRTKKCSSKLNLD